MELLLWRWSTAVQLSSALMIAVFFLVLSRSVRRVELKPWVLAWALNLMALVVANLYWLYRPDNEFVFWLVRFAYIGFKTLFVAYLIIGAAYFGSQWYLIRMQRSILVIAVGYSLVSSFVFDSIPKIGVGEYALMAIVFLLEAIVLIKNAKESLGWLCAGLILHAALSAFEGAMFAGQLMGKNLLAEPMMDFFLSAHSSFDTGVEWVIALGCVLAIYSRIQHELTKSNTDLLLAQEVLHRLADRDPLTSLENRRALPNIFRTAFPTGATILFFDLDGFKEINDQFGHSTGDDCLRTFARALLESFRPTDHVIRYAGDEFVVVAPGADLQVALERIEMVHDHLLRSSNSGPEIRFSVGHAFLTVNGDSEAALRAADEDMYRQKSRTHGSENKRPAAREKPARA